MVGIDRAASIQNTSGLLQCLPADFAAGSPSKIDRMHEAGVMTWQPMGPERRRRARLWRQRPTAADEDIRWQPRGVGSSHNVCGTGLIANEETDKAGSEETDHEV